MLINHDNGLLKDTKFEGSTPLIAAIRAGHIDVVRFLINRGASVHETATGGTTALMAACRKDRLDIIRLLLNAGADVEASDAEQRTALHIAAVWSGVEAMRELICEHNANMFATSSDGNTIFDKIYYRGRDVVVRTFLIEAYGIKMVQDKGRLALHSILSAAYFWFAEAEGFHLPSESVTNTPTVGQAHIGSFPQPATFLGH